MLNFVYNLSVIDENLFSLLLCIMVFLKIIFEIDISMREVTEFSLQYETEQFIKFHQIEER